MEINSPKELFDKAYTHLLAGDIKDAADCFQFVVDNPNSFDDHIIRLALQRILWYCIPLDAIFTAMGKNPFPVNIHSILIDTLSSDNRYNEAEIEPILNSIESHLAKMPDCIRVGEYFWMYRKVIEKLASRIVPFIVNNMTPISLASIYTNEWTDFCSSHTKFPDHYSEAALARVVSKLQCNHHR